MEPAIALAPRRRHDSLASPFDDTTPSRFDIRHDGTTVHGVGVQRPADRVLDESPNSPAGSSQLRSNLEAWPN